MSINRLFRKNHEPVEVIGIPYSVHQTNLGNYFFGQTELVSFGGGDHAWGGLFNPRGSGVNMFWNVYTISNFSREPFTADFWLNSTIPGARKISKKIASANQALVPVPQPKVEIQYAEGLRSSPSGGYFSFIRRVEPLSTLTRHDFQGMIIIPPGSSVLVFLQSSGVTRIETRLAFGWWEQKGNGLS